MRFTGLLVLFRDETTASKISMLVTGKRLDESFGARLLPRKPDGCDLDRRITDDTFSGRRREDARAGRKWLQSPLKSRSPNKSLRR
jgi:hypothetical protein